MFGSLISVLLASSALVASLPSGNVSLGDSSGFGALDERGLFGPISTGSAAGIAGGQVACGSPPLSSFFAGLEPPFPTNSWWAPYAAPPGTGTAAGPFPYQSALDGYGVLFGISVNRQFDGTSIKQPTQNDWRASFSEHSGTFANHKATAFDTQSVTVQYFQGSSSMTAYLVPGSPYMTFAYNAATPLLTSMNGGIKSFNGQALTDGGSATATGTQFTVVDTTGTTYLIYALSSITLTATSVSSTSGTVRGGATFTGVLRLVKLADPGHKALLDQHHQVYPTSVGLDYSFTDTTGTLIFNWQTVGDGSQLLMLTWPHHRLTMQNPNFPATTALGYLTTKGWMYPAIGNQWRMLHQLSSISWNAPRALDSSCSSSVLQGLAYEVGQLDPAQAPVPGDFYYWGGTLAAKARLALIADNLGRSDLVTPVVNYLKASFNHWFDSSASTVPAYETAWGGVVNKAGASNANVDFGNGYYNDHHFHYGYFLTVAAVIAKFDGAWLSQHRDYINWFARDIINPSTQDPYFPVTRCRDWFAGHSWASGIANGAGSRDQESSGEAVSGYYGALLWASVALSQDYVNYAKLLIATEQQASQVYWHLYPQKGQADRDNPYPEPAVRNLVTMGNVMDWQSGAWLFWGAQRSLIAAIQILPLIPVNEALYDTQWVENMWSYTMPELVDPTIGDEWKCLIIAAYSNAHPQVAAAWSANLTNWGTGNTYTNELYFIGTRPNPLGTPICASLPQNPYGTFKLQVAATGNYVAVASSANPNLVASPGISSSAASSFTSAYVPNAGTLQLASTGQYVTADQSGNYPLAGSRATASTWERFVIRRKVGAAEGVYTIKAASNGRYVTVASDGSLVNDGVEEAAGAGFRFVKV
ncbi:glycosyl hydrolase family 81-domain-containing protein [Achaetomium macrosporum]|uniref:glucan endo-1,3-beta-D-glucosidase n=1 Tax=Achaetomium macrosporum TaxID=79813 RepID=A0AAN7C5Y7_9PEZI|nr:glycosyl hydrolase family 81-domain-containing protein [Achaetomium macrosporum]